MTTQAQLDEMIANAKAALYAINPAYAPDYVPEEKKPLRNSAVTFKQVDWTGEQSLRNYSSGSTCPVCSKILYRDLLRVGRKHDYCSDACKMKAYRQRKKALRNSQRVKVVL
jgi:predicted nucleic acid-binding Zn ribbon protein